MVKRLFSFILCLLLLSTVIPQAGLAETEINNDAVDNLFNSDVNGYVIDGVYYPITVQDAPQADAPQVDFPQLGLPQPGFLADGHVHVPGQTVKENVVAGSCTTAGSYDEVTYCAVCGQEMNRVRFSTESSHAWDENGICTLCGSRTVKDTHHVYSDDGHAKAVVYGLVPEGVSVLIRPAALTAAEFAALLPASVREADLLAGEFRVYDISMQYANGTKYTPAYELGVTMNPDFERNELLHVFYIHEAIVDYLKDGTPVYATVAEELQPELDREGIRMTFSAVVGGRYAFYSEADLWSRVAKRLELLPELTTLEDEDIAKSVERKLLEIDNLTEILVASDRKITYEKVFDEMDWARYNDLRALVAAYFGYGDMKIESEPAEDGAVAIVSGKLPVDAAVTIQAVEFSEEDLAGYLGRTRAGAITSYAAYDITIWADGEEWQPDNSVIVSVRQPDLPLEKGESFAVAHVDEETDTASSVKLAEITEAGDAAFVAESFSVYILYTVDFHFEDTVFCIEGNSSILLSELFAQLGIDIDVSEVTDLVFSNPDLLRVERIEYEGEPAGEGEAEGEPAGEVRVDWLLTSLEPFETEEYLTFTLADGTVFELLVTDQPLGVLWDYTNDTISVGSGTFNTNLITKAADGITSWVTTTSRNVPINPATGQPYTAVVTSRSGNKGKITYHGETYYLVLASSTQNAFDGIYSSSNPSPLPCITYRGTVVAWFEKPDGTKVVLDNVCVGNMGWSDLWYWQFGGDGAKVIYTDGSVTKNSYGSVVAEENEFQGILPDADGYYTMYMTNRKKNGSTSTSYVRDEVYVFEMTNSIMVTKVVDGDNKQFTFNYTTPSDSTSFSLAHNEIRRFLTFGNNITVSETPDSDYVLEGIEVKYGSYTRTVTDDSSVTLTPDEVLNDCTIIFTNRSKYASLHVKKQLENATDGTFEYTASFTDPDGQPVEPNPLPQGASVDPQTHAVTFSLTVTDGNVPEIIFPGLPRGTTYTVEEVDYSTDDYTVQHKLDDGDPEEGASASGELDISHTETFINTNKHTTLTVMKSLVNDTEGTFNFSAFFTKNGQPFEPDPLPTGARVVDDTTKEIRFSLTVPGNPIVFPLESGIHYKITELDHKAYTVTSKINNVSTTTGDSAEADLTANSTVEFINTLKSGVKFTKIVKGGGDKTKSFTINVTSDKKITAATDGSYELVNDYTARFELKHGESVVVDIPYSKKGIIFIFNDYNYITSITETDADGYEKKFTVSEGGGPSQTMTFNYTLPFEGTSASITVTNDMQFTPDTGVLLDSLPYVIILAAAAGAAVLFVLKRRRRDDD